MLSESRSLDLMRITGCNDGDKGGGKCFRLYSEKMCPIQRALLSCVKRVVTGPIECIMASWGGQNMHRKSPDVNFVFPVNECQMLMILMID